MPELLHPRRAKYGRYWGRYRERRRRVTPGVLTSERPRASDPLWMDYYPWAPGTVPEKMVFAELVNLGVTFFFGAYWGDMPFTEDKYEHYRPDFVLPDQRVIIEIYGTYWHTREDSYEKDAWRAALYAAAGYTYYALWDWEVFNGAALALRRIPELVNPSVRGGKIFLSDRPFDPTASLTAQRRKAPKVVRTEWRGPGRRERRRATLPLSVTKPRLRPPKRKEAERAVGFEKHSEAYLRKVRDYGRDWKNYMDELDDFFTRYGDRAIRAYPKEYRYYLRWRDWWTRWQKMALASPAWADYIRKLGIYFRKYPQARGRYLEAYYRWLSWRRMGYRRL